MFGSNQSLPDTLSLQLLTCLYLPKVATSQLLLPQQPFLPSWSPIPPIASSSDDEVFCFHLVLKEIQHALFYFSLSFNCFLRLMPPHIYPQTLPQTPALTPPAQDQSWEWPAQNIVVCWEQHGVMWMRPGEAQSGVDAPELLSDVSLSAKRFSAFNL